MNIVLSGNLQKFTAYQREHSVAAVTVREGLENLAKAYPELSKVLFDPAGQLRRAHTLFLNGNQIWAEQLIEKVGDRDRLEILTAIAGG
jgi:molybdopterin converting factor small subunit